MIFSRTEELSHIKCCGLISSQWKTTVTKWARLHLICDSPYKKCGYTMLPSGLHNPQELQEMLFQNLRIECPPSSVTFPHQNMLKATNNKITMVELTDDEIFTVKFAMTLARGRPPERKSFTFLMHAACVSSASWDYMEILSFIFKTI